jgi:thiosulfate/3-mercaptopyruvate sulfurtransferase
MNRLFPVVCVLAFTLAAGGSAPKAQPRPTMLVQTSWLAAHLNDKNLVILHVGTDRAAYEARHIPGARFLALSEIAVNRNGVPNELPPAATLKTVFERLGVSDQSRVVLYGERLGILAARAYFTLDYLGHGANAALLDGGLEKWSAEQRPISNAPAMAPAPGLLSVRLRPELLVDLAAVKKIAAEKTLPLIDARPAADFSAGHIPGAKDVFWMDNLVSQSDPALKPLQDIAARYRSAGLRPGSKVVVYCHTGMQAAQDYFTLKLAGFRPVLYDGSFIEWSHAEAPVEPATK